MLPHSELAQPAVRTLIVPPSSGRTPGLMEVMVGVTCAEAAAERQRAIVRRMERKQVMKLF
jgi:hypothetical protein